MQATFLERPEIARRFTAAVPAAIGTVIWAHALAALAKAPPSLAAGLTIAAVLTAITGAMAYDSRRKAAVAGALAGLLAAAVLALLTGRSNFAPALALLPAGAIFAAGGAWFAGRLPAGLATNAHRRPLIAAAWVAVSLLSIVQVGRLSTYMTDRDSDWFLSTRHPFYAKHECMNAYLYGAELERRGEENIYDPAHYPGLNPAAEPVTVIAGMTPEDPYQYPPQFLLLPRLAIGLSNDYQTIRMIWFGINVTLCMAAVLLLAGWVGGSVGALTAWLSPAVLVSFPVLHNFQYGQFHFAAVALGILGLIAFSKQRPALGGSLLSFAIMAKLFPGILLVPLVVQRRWRDLAWTAAAGALITAITFGVVGPEPFEAFLGSHVPRLASGEAFAFEVAWPEIADLVLIGNQGVRGVMNKLAALGMPAGDSSARIIGMLYALLLIGAAIRAGSHERNASRAQRAVVWIALLGLGSLASAGAWADYVPLTSVWLLAAIAPLAIGNRPLTIALGACAILQMTLIGTVPFGSITNGSWMLPLSLVSALVMLVLFAGGVLSVGRRSAAAYESLGHLPRMSGVPSEFA